MINKWVYKSITVFFLAISFPAYSQLVTIDFTATVDTVDDMYNSLNGSVTVGETVTGSFTFDTDLTDNDATSEHGQYQYPDIVPENVGINAQIGDLRFDRTYATNSTNYFLHVANTSYFDSFDAMMNGNGQSIGMLSNHEAYVDDISVIFGSQNTNVVNSDTIDEAVANLANFTDNRFAISGRGTSSNDNFYITAKITSFTSSADIGSCEPPKNNEPKLAFKAKVMNIYQSNPANISPIALGEIISGSYEFDPNTPDTNPSIEYAQYYHNAGNAFSGVNLEIAGSNYSGNQSTTTVEIKIDNFPANTGSDFYEMMALNADMQLSSGITINEIIVHFYDPTGAVLSANTLAEGTPTSINGWQYKDLLLSGTYADGSYFYINAAVEEIGNSSTPTPSSPLQISPASGPLVMNQYFDAGIVIDAGYSPIAFIDATLDNMYGPMYINCGYIVQSSDGRQTVLCRNISDKLIPGTNSLSIRINFVDGQELNSTVNWDVVGN